MDYNESGSLSGIGNQIEAIGETPLLVMEPSIDGSGRPRPRQLKAKNHPTIGPQIDALKGRVAALEKGGAMQIADYDASSASNVSSAGFNASAAFGASAPITGTITGPMSVRYVRLTAQVPGRITGLQLGMDPIVQGDVTLDGQNPVIITLVKPIPAKNTSVSNCTFTNDDAALTGRGSVEFLSKHPGDRTS